MNKRAVFLDENLDYNLDYVPGGEYGDKTVREIEAELKEKQLKEKQQNEDTKD